MRIEDKLWNLAMPLLLVVVFLEMALGAGAFHLLETGRKFTAFPWEAFASVSIGLTMPLCAAVVIFKVLSSYESMLWPIRVFLIGGWLYWLLSYSVFLTVSSIAHSSTPIMTFAEVFEMYFVDNWRHVTSMATFSFFNSNLILPALMLTAMGHDQHLLRKAGVEADEKALKDLVTSAGTPHQRKVMEALMAVGVELNMNQIIEDSGLSRSQAVIACKSLVKSGKVVQTKGDGRTKLYEAVRE